MRLGQCLAQEATNKYRLLCFQRDVCLEEEPGTLAYSSGLEWKPTLPERNNTQNPLSLSSPSRGSEPGVHGFPRGQRIQWGGAVNSDGKKNTHTYLHELKLNIFFSYACKSTRRL